MATEASSPPRPNHGFWRKHGLKLAASVLIAGAFAWTLERGGLPLIPPAAAFAKVNISSCIEYLLLLFAWHFVRATRWRHLLSPSPTFRCAVSSRSHGSALPRFADAPPCGRVRAPLHDPPARPDFDRRGHRHHRRGAHHRWPLSHASARNRTAVLPPLGSASRSHRQTADPGRRGPLLRLCVAGGLQLRLRADGALLLALRVRARWSPRLWGSSRRSWPTKLAGFVAHTVEGLKVPAQFSQYAGFLLETAFYWFANGVGTWVLARGCGVESSPRPGVRRHGGLGRRHPRPRWASALWRLSASVFAGLAMFFPDDIVLGPGLAFVFLLYVFQFAWHILAAAFFLLIDRAAAREVVAAESGLEICPFRASPGYDEDAKRRTRVAARGWARPLSWAPSPSRWPSASPARRWPKRASSRLTRSRRPTTRRSGWCGSISAWPYRRARPRRRVLDLRLPKPRRWRPRGARLDRDARDGARCPGGGPAHPNASVSRAGHRRRAHEEAASATGNRRRTAISAPLPTRETWDPRPASERNLRVARLFPTGVHPGGRAFRQRSRSLAQAPLADLLQLSAYAAAGVATGNPR